MKKLLTFLFIILFSIPLFSQSRREVKTDMFDVCSIDFQTEIAHDCETNNWEVNWVFLYNEEDELYRIAFRPSNWFESSLIAVQETHWEDIDGQDFLVVHGGTLTEFDLILEYVVLYVNFEYKSIIVFPKEEFQNKENKTINGVYYYKNLRR